MVGSEANPLKVAIVGSGPSGFYAVQALYKQHDLHVEVDMFERLPTPFGLVRGGVAPDHQTIKGIADKYHKSADHDGFRFFGNVMLGRDISVADLEAHYHQIIYAVGNEADRRLGLPGEELRCVQSATEFVGWYNGHPDFEARDFPLKRAKRAVVIGNGNVAMDVARIISMDPEVLQPTDIAAYALDALRTSSIEEVVVVGRRGPAQAAFSPKELKEMAKTPGIGIAIDPEEATTDPVTQAWLDSGDAPRSAQKNLEMLQALADAPTQGSHTQVRFMFCASPTAFEGGDHLEQVRMQRNRLVERDGVPRPEATDETFVIPCDVVFRAVGYRGVKIPGVPFDERRGIIPNEQGRVLESADGNVVPGHYVVGWAKRGPTGLIGTNGPDARATVAQALEDAATVDGDCAGPVEDLLRQKGVDWVSYEDWERLDAHERGLGAEQGRIRMKFTSIESLMEEIRKLR